MWAKKSKPLRIFPGNIQPRFRALQRFARALNIDLRRPFRRLRQNGDLVRQHFGKAPCNSKHMLRRISSVLNLADGKLGNQRRMPRQNPQIPVLAGNLRFRRSRLNDFLLRRNNLELESICHKFGFGLQLSGFGKAPEPKAWLKPESRSPKAAYAAAFIFSADSSTSSMVPFK